MNANQQAAIAYAQNVISKAVHFTHILRSSEELDITHIISENFANPMALEIEFAAGSIVVALYFSEHGVFAAQMEITDRNGAIWRFAYDKDQNMQPLKTEHRFVSYMY